MPLPLPPLKQLLLLALCLPGAWLCAQTAARTSGQAGAQTSIQTSIQTSAPEGLQATPAPRIDPLHPPTAIISPLTQPTVTPGALLLLELEGRFGQAVAAGGGKAFSTWFADDAVTLNNGRPPVLGRAAITRQALWDPKDYQLTWAPQGASMGPSNDMGYTWGHYEGRARDKAGQPIITTGRYITVWKKQPGGEWKVTLDASAEEPPNSGECCTLPKP